MTNESIAVAGWQPPPALIHLVNPIVMLLLRSPLGGPMRKELMVLHFTGHKSGRRYDIPVGQHRFAGELYVLTGSRWRHNFVDGTDLRVSVGADTISMHGTVVDDPEITAKIYARRVGNSGRGHSGDSGSRSMYADRLPSRSSQTPCGATISRPYASLPPGDARRPPFQSIARIGRFNLEESSWILPALDITSPMELARLGGSSTPR